MKNMSGMMFSILMDDIKDLDMILGYIDDISVTENSDFISWLKNRAKDRADTMRVNYDYVKKQTKLEEKVNHNDEIAIALNDYLCKSVTELMARVQSL